MNEATDMRTAETGQGELFIAPSAAGSGVVSPLIGPQHDGLRRGDVDSTDGRRTSITPRGPGTSGSTTATRTTTTSRTRVARSWSADENAARRAGFTWTAVVQAYLDCRLTKRRSAGALQFEQRQEGHLAELHADLSAGSYQPGRSICFVITRPRPREVWAAPFRDRIVHHLLYNRIGAAVERTFIADSCACIPGRGT